MTSDPRQTDHELRPYPDGWGWTCPKCGQAATIFCGMTPRRRCKACTQAGEQR